MIGDDHNTHVGLDHNLICNTYMLKVDHNSITSIILHKAETLQKTTPETPSKLDSTLTPTLDYTTKKVELH